MVEKQIFEVTLNFVNFESSERYYVIGQLF